MAEPCPWLKQSWLSVFVKAGGPATSYVSFILEGNPVGISLLQALPVSGMKLGPSVRPNIASVLFGKEVKQFGQALFSGPGGHHFLDGIDAGMLLMAAAKEIAENDASCWKNVSCWLAKDLASSLELPGWQKLEVLPELILKFPATWQSPADYYGAMKSKYRRRINRARRKFEGLRRVELDADAAEEYRSEIGNLYDALIERADYVPFKVPPGYISDLKSSKPENVILSGYFDGNKLIGFSTLLIDCQFSIAHFAAIDPDYNSSHQLYLNLLIDLVEQALDNGVTTLNFGRTATTIKTSIGAVPIAQHSYARHDSCLRNQLLSVLNDRVLSGEPEAQVQNPFD